MCMASRRLRLRATYALRRCPVGLRANFARGRQRQVLGGRWIPVFPLHPPPTLRLRRCARRLGKKKDRTRKVPRKNSIGIACLVLPFARRAAQSTAQSRQPFFPFLFIIFSFLINLSFFCVPVWRTATRRAVVFLLFFPMKKSTDSENKKRVTSAARGL